MHVTIKNGSFPTKDPYYCGYHGEFQKLSKRRMERREQLSERMNHIQLCWFKQPLHLLRHTLNSPCSLLHTWLTPPIKSLPISDYTNIYRTLKGPTNIKC